MSAQSNSQGFVLACATLASNKSRSWLSPDRRGHKRPACANHDANPYGDELAQLPSCQLDVDRGRLHRLLARISDAAFVRRRVVLTEPKGSRFDRRRAGLPFA